MNQNDSILFFQGTDLVVPAEISDDDNISIAESNSSGSPFQWQTDLLNLIQYNAVPLTIEKIPLLDGNGFINAALLDDSLLLPDEWKRTPIRSILRFAEQIDLGFLSRVQSIFRAYHILQWKKNTVFCGRCGGKNQDSEKDISQVCTSCGNSIFPKISPAVIVLITDRKDRILLARNKNFTYPFYSLIAGFVEAGESLEQTVVREVKEEVNIDVDSIEYILSQPWPFPDSIMIGFRAKYSGGELKPDGDEISDADWFSRGALPEIPRPGAISRYLIDQWQEEKIL